MIFLEKSTVRPFWKGYLVPKRNVGQLILIWIGTLVGEDAGGMRRADRGFTLWFSQGESLIKLNKKAKKKITGINMALICSCTLG